MGLLRRVPAVDTPTLPGFGPPPADLLHDPLPRARTAPRPEAPASTTEGPSTRRPDWPFAIEVVRSARRKRTVGAQMVGEVLRVTVPTWMSAREQAMWVDKMAARFTRKRSTDAVDLPARAKTLARRHDLPHPRDIRWVDDMRTRWGSCTPVSGTIRISSRVSTFPSWVLDYVIVHELAHLEVPDHSPAFWRLVARFPLAERARGYLIAKSGSDEDDDRANEDDVSRDTRS